LGTKKYLPEIPGTGIRRKRFPEKMTITASQNPYWQVQSSDINSGGRRYTAKKNLSLEIQVCYVRKESAEQEERRSLQWERRKSLNRGLKKEGYGRRMEGSWPR
jgi:hypothetical protein